MDPLLWAVQNRAYESSTYDCTILKKYFFKTGSFKKRLIVPGIYTKCMNQVENFARFCTFVPWRRNGLVEMLRHSEILKSKKYKFSNKLQIRKLTSAFRATPASRRELLIARAVQYWTSGFETMTPSFLKIKKLKSISKKTWLKTLPCMSIVCRDPALFHDLTLTKLIRSSLNLKANIDKKYIKLQKIKIHLLLGHSGQQ